jgi:hypothetical protein
MGAGEKGEDHVNLNDGDACVKVFEGPPRSPSVDKQPEGGGVHNAMKNLECFLLRFFGVEAQYLGERFKVPIPEGRDGGRRGWQDRGSKKVEFVEGPSDALEDVRGDAFKKVVSKAIVGTEKAGSNGLAIPARVRHGPRKVTTQR